jgi:hypothetical protein
MQAQRVKAKGFYLAHSGTRPRGEVDQLGKSLV